MTPQTIVFILATWSILGFLLAVSLADELSRMPGPPIWKQLVVLLITGPLVMAVTIAIATRELLKKFLETSDPKPKDGERDA